MDRARAKLGDKVTIPAVVEEIEHTILGEINYKVVPLNTWFDADEIEALGQTKSEDCISRQQVVEAVTNTIREKFSLADWYEQLVETGLEIENLIKELPPVTPTVSEDCISREYMLKLQRELHGWMPNDKSHELWQKIKDAPSVTPTERTGEWVNSKGEPVDDRYSVYCSRCKAWSEYRDIYCGNCGAKMGGNYNE